VQILLAAAVSHPPIIHRRCHTPISFLLTLLRYHSSINLFTIWSLLFLCTLLLALFIATIVSVLIFFQSTLPFSLNIFSTELCVQGTYQLQTLDSPSYVAELPRTPQCHKTTWTAASTYTTTYTATTKHHRLSYHNSFHLFFHVSWLDLVLTSLLVRGILRIVTVAMSCTLNLNIGSSFLSFTCFIKLTEYHL
jgi:hypothetical protein